MSDFSDFDLAEIGDRGVGYLADGLIPEMANVFGVELSERPSSDELFRLVGAMGASRVLEDNLPQVQEVLGTTEDSMSITAGWLERSGVQKPLNRSLWRADIQAPPDAPIIMTGGMANWMDRTTQLLVTRREEYGGGDLYIPIGSRIMAAQTEATNPNIIRYSTEYNEPPSELQYARDFVLPQLVSAGYNVRVHPYDTENGGEIATAFVNEKVDLFLYGSRVTFARVANAGIQLAGQFRNALKAFNSDFDENPLEPQVFVVTDGFPIAHTQEEFNNPQTFQRPQTGIKQIAVTAMGLTQAVRN